MFLVRLELLWNAAADGIEEKSSWDSQLLLRAGARVNNPAHGSFGSTALWTGVYSGDLDIIELLLKYGADVETSETEALDVNRAALLFAVEHDHVRLVEVLLEYKANPNALAYSYYGSAIFEVAKARQISGRQPRREG